MLHIWFNRTYATNVHTFALLRDNPDGVPVRIFATHADPTSPVMAAADVAEPEPAETVSGEDYLAWALEFCRRHRIEVFVPRLHLDLVAAARARFAALGVAVVAGPAEAAALFEDKAAAYADAAQAGLPVPPHRVVTTGAALETAYDELTEELLGGEVVLKPVSGVGGQGFRRLTREPLTFAQLTGPLTPRLRVEEAAAALDAAGDERRPLMLLPYLPGPEISVDCLADDDGRVIAAVPRTKSGRRRLLVDDPMAVDVAVTIIRRHRLSSLSNTQVRYWQHPVLDSEKRPYLLETNARISGGLYQTAISGLNLPWAAVCLARGEDVLLPQPKLGLAYTETSSIVVERL